MQRQQAIHNQQLGAHGQANYQVQQEMAQMRERNRQRGATPSQSSTDPVTVIPEHPGPNATRVSRTTEGITSQDSQWIQ